MWPRGIHNQVILACSKQSLASQASSGTPAVLTAQRANPQRGIAENGTEQRTTTEPEILAILRPMIKHYALERQEGEHFGDFVIRTGYIAPTTEGKAWYDRMGGEGEHREGAVAA